MNCKNRTRNALLAAAALAGYLTNDAAAVNKTWAVAASDNWTTAAAWVLSGAPANGDAAFITAAGPTNYLVNYDNPSTTQLFTFLTLNNTGGGAAQLRTNGGTVYNASNATVGGTGLGHWQIGSAAANLGSLNIATGASGAGTVTLSSGTVTTNRINLGSNGAAVMTQTGGLVDVATLTVNNGGSGSGVYNHQGGTLNADVIVINSGGTLSHGSSLNASTVTLNTGGTYSYVAGTTSVDSFTQEGGTILNEYFNNNRHFIYNSGSFAGHFENLGTFTLNADMIIGDGMDNRSDGNSIPVGRTMTLNGSGLNHRAGTMFLSGTLNSTTTGIGGANAASNALFAHQSGVHNISDELDVGMSFGAGTYNLNNGTLNINGPGAVGASIGVTQPGLLNIVNGRANISHLRVGNGAAGTVNHNGGGDLVATNITVGSLSAGIYIQNSAGATVSASNGLIIGTQGRYNLINGSLTSGQTSNNGTYTQSGGVANLNQVGGTGGMDILGTASLSVDRIRQDSLFVADTARIFTTANGTANGLSRLNTLFFEDFENLSFFGKWDLNNNDVVVDSTTGTIADEYDRVKSYIRSGFNFGSWTGNGLNSSAAIAAAATANRTGLGYARAADVLAFSGGTATFVGQVVDDTTVLVRYTLLGDSDLNGVVDIGDFAFLAPNFNAPSDWRTGDYTYDGVTNLDDFAFLASNFNKTLAGDLPRGAAVPEPTNAALALLSGFAARRRRR